MKQIIFFLWLLALSATTHAKSSLPRPVFSEEPAHLRIVIDHVAPQMVKGEVLSYKFLHVPQEFPVWLAADIRLSGGHGVWNAQKERCQFDVDLDTKCSGPTQVKLVWKGDSLVLNDLIIVPGKTTIVRYDGSTGKTDFSGPFAKLNAELHQYLSCNDNGVIVRYPVKMLSDISTDLPPRQYLEEMNRRISQSMKQVAKEGHSKQFSEIFEVAMQAEKIKRMIGRIKDNNPELRLNSICSLMAGTNPFATHACFYGWPVNNSMWIPKSYLVLRNFAWDKNTQVCNDVKDVMTAYDMMIGCFNYGKTYNATELRNALVDHQDLFLNYVQSQVEWANEIKRKSEE